jgi:hypothetical protein
MTICFSQKKKILYPLQQALGSITLTAEQRIIFEERYIRVIDTSYNKCAKIFYLFNVNRIIITTGSIIIPALLSIQYKDITSEVRILYWFTWSISICVTISNAVLTMFKFDKKYYMFHATYEQLITEGWQFLALTGHYKSNSNSNFKTHSDQFQNFTERIEKILMLQAETEYIKLQDVNGGNSINSSNSSQPSNSSGIPNLVGMTTPVNDDFIIRLAKVIYPHLPKEESPRVVGGPTDQDDNKVKRDFEFRDAGSKAQTETTREKGSSLS